MANKNNNVVTIISLLVIGISGLLFFFGNRKKEQNLISSKATAPSQEAIDTKLQLSRVFLEAYKDYALRDDGKHLSKSIIIEDTALTKMPLSKLVQKTNLLIFRYSVSDCDLCTNSVINSIKSTFKKEEQKAIRILIDSRDERDFRIKMQNQHPGIDTYNMAERDLGLTLEKKNLPFLFILTPALQVTKIFIPFKETPEDTQDYLKYIKSFLFANSDSL